MVDNLSFFRSLFRLLSFVLLFIHPLSPLLEMHTSETSFDKHIVYLTWWKKSEHSHTVVRNKSSLVDSVRLNKQNDVM